MKIAILGFDREGRATYDFFAGKGHEITVCDQNDQLVLPADVNAKLGADYLENLDTFDLIVRTPGLHPGKILEKNPQVGDKITSGTNLFFENCPTKNIIGVTGTKGKGTTSTLISKILEADGKGVHLLGNIGTPMLSALGDLTADSWAVLELSNFQLIDLKYSPHIATCLMVEPEHLDWHEDFEEYIAAKQQLFIHQLPEDIAVYFANNENSLSIADASEGQLIPYFAAPGAEVIDNNISIGGQVICNVGKLKLIGKHNWQNACAAVTTAWQVTQNAEAIRSVLTSFSGLEHRLEFVREVGGIKYYDDSFGTTPQTAQVAIESFEEPKVVILGGSDKGASFDELAKTVSKNNVRAVVRIGKMGPVIADALQKHGYTAVYDGGSNMTSIVETANKLAEPGDVVLLSTGCASFDMFENYKDRGNQFVQSVKALGPQ
jgi:UDP-N-acetylmuramoylalanine--D-glutamate ligase